MKAKKIQVPRFARTDRHFGSQHWPTGFSYAVGIKKGRGIRPWNQSEEVALADHRVHARINWLNSCPLQK